MSYFDVVKQFDALRSGLTPPAPRAVLEAPTVSVGPVAPPVVAPPAAAPPPSTAPKPQGQPTKGRTPLVPTVPVGPLKLVSWAGRQFDAAVLPKLQQLTASVPGLRVTSGYRDPHQNHAAKGVPTSWHLKGRAADFVGGAREMQAGAAWARANGAREVLVHNVGSGQHLHVAWRRREIGNGSNQALLGVRCPQGRGRVLPRQGLSGGQKAAVQALL